MQCCMIKLKKKYFRGNYAKVILKILIVFVLLVAENFKEFSAWINIGDYLIKTK